MLYLPESLAWAPGIDAVQTRADEAVRRLLVEGVAEWGDNSPEHLEVEVAGVFDIRD